MSNSKESGQKKAVLFNYLKKIIPTKALKRQVIYIGRMGYYFTRSKINAYDCHNCQLWQTLAAVLLKFRKEKKKDYLLTVSFSSPNFKLVAAAPINFVSSLSKRRMFAPM